VAGTIEIAEANMANAVRSVSIWKGLDPRDLTLVAFGGAGGAVACRVARALDIPRVLVPVYPGNTCAMGLLMTDMQEDATVAYLARANEVALDVLNERLGELQERVRATLVAQGVDESDVTYKHVADLRYHGQIHELSIPFERLPVTDEVLEQTFQAFEQLYEDIYTIRLEGGAPEMTSLRVTGVGQIPQYRLEAFTRGDAAEPTGSREALEDGQWSPVAVYSRYALPAGTLIQGPAIIEEPGSTIWVASGMSGEVDPYGNVVIASGVPAQAREVELVEEA
jgi:N-methylhydantoinase A/oxoprolinase/acetone carboxylase beta subunit